MNKVITSKEAILAVCRELAEKQGLQVLNMRVVAEKCGVSVGAIYNYFPSKADLIAAVVKDVWSSIFQDNHSREDIGNFTDYIAWMFESVRSSTMEHPNFFTIHSLSFPSADKGKGRLVMEQYFTHMKSRLLYVLQNDSAVNQAVFSEDFSQTAFVNYVFSSVIMLLMKQETSCAILLEFIKRAIY